MKSAAVNAEPPEAFAAPLPPAGEGAPPVLVAVLAVMGVALAVVSASIWLAPPVTPPDPVTIVVHDKAPPADPVTIVVHEKSPPPPPTVIRAPMPIPAQAAAPRAPCFDPVTLIFARGAAAPLAGADAGVGIARLRDWLGGHAEGRLLVEGHADSLGGEARNLALSFARAKTVASILARNGIPASRITLRAAGAAEASATIDAPNRRVVVGVEGLTACKSANGAMEHP